MGDQINRLTRISVLVIGVVAMQWCLGTPSADANIVRGLAEVVAGVFALPMGIIQGTFSGPPVLGTVVGAVSGTINTVTLVAGGAMDIVSGVIPLAQAAAPFVLPFLF